MSARAQGKGPVRIGRLAEGAHFALAVALALALAALLCYTSTRRFVHMDWRSAARQPLTRDTRTLLARVGEDVHVTLIYPTLRFPDHQDWMRTREMVRQVLAQFHAANPRILVDELNWSTPQGQARLQRIVQQTGETNLPVVCVLFSSARGHQVISFDRLAVEAGGALGQAGAFLGESTFARALAALTGLQKLAPDPTSGARRMPSIDLPPATVRSARYMFIGALPTCFVVLGALVYLVRRR